MAFRVNLQTSALAKTDCPDRVESCRWARSSSSAQEFRWTETWPAVSDAAGALEHMQR